MNGEELRKKVLKLHGQPGMQELVADYLDEVLREAYDAGWRRGAWDYAVHKDGELLVGVMQRPYKIAVRKGPDANYRAIDMENLAEK